MSQRRTSRRPVRRRPQGVACLLRNRQDDEHPPLDLRVSFDVTPADVRRAAALADEHGWDLRRKR